MKKLILLTLLFLTTAAQQAIFAQTPVLLEAGKPLERELTATETQQFQIVLKQGEYLNAAVNQRGIDVVVRVFAPDDSKIAEIDSPNGKNGDEPIALEAKTGGTYRIEVAALNKDAPTGRYEIRIDKILSVEENAKRLAENKRQEQSVISWLKSNSFPIKTVEAGNGFADLQPFKKIFKDVRFVGLGEQTHGTREFFQFKHRMLEFLVREMNFRVFAIEASYAASQNVNDYINGKSDDGAKALDGLGFFSWNTEEVRAMLDWMREYNKSVSADKKLKFVGFDTPYNEPGKDKILAYLRRVAPERVAETEEFFKTNLDELILAGNTPERLKATAPKLAEQRQKYNDLYVYLDLSGAQLTAKSDQAEYEQILEYARLLTQHADIYSRPDLSGVVVRDYYMADNFRRIVAREAKDTRFVIWAHNAHIAVTNQQGASPTLGYNLRRFYGSEYYALGFSFNQGSFQAREMLAKDPEKRMLTAYSVAPAANGWVDWYLAQTGSKLFFTDLRPTKKTAEINEWFAAPHRMRLIGAIFAPNAESRFTVPVVLKEEFDGLFFIDTTTRARPNPSVKNVARTQ